MNTTIITRELLEHYLRATGWTRDAKDWWCRGSWRVGTFDGMTDYEIAAQVNRLAEAEAKRVPGPLVGARLGMCASSEQVRSEALRLVDTPACFALARVADDLLKAAGIDPATWEAAR